MANQEIAFRRINGRVVPIKMGQRKELAVKGSGQLAAGVATSIATGAVTSKMIRQSHAFRVKSQSAFHAAHEAIASIKRGQMTFNDTETISRAAKETAKAVKKRALAGRLFSVRNKLLLAGAAISAGLLGAGASKLIEATRGKKNEFSQEGIARTSGTIAAAAVYGSYYKGLPIKGLGKIAANVAARMKGHPRPHQAAWW